MSKTCPTCGSTPRTENLLLVLLTLIVIGGGALIILLASHTTGGMASLQGHNELQSLTAALSNIKYFYDSILNILIL